MLTNETFVNLLDGELKKFSDDYFPLHSRQLGSIKRCTAVVDEVGIGKNLPRQRAHDILNDLWTHAPEVFVLAALAATPTKLSTLKSVDYMVSVLKWWEGVEVPGGLTKILDRHSDILPSVARDSLELRLPVAFGELLGFLQQNFGQMQVEISLPFSGSPSPYVRVAGVKIELSTELANSFLHRPS